VATIKNRFLALEKKENPKLDVYDHIIANMVVKSFHNKMHQSVYKLCRA